ncbi:GNAT family N-acetyltransferase [Streptomyces sp. NPDC049879]|uniref:GNAT family N-acetyltransferase n=1 Tax=Streptomyces sp. NPDC049879 TaxID=3365598 RepID=UPI0037896494
MSFDIRRLTAEDTEDVARLRVAGWRYAYQDVVPDAYLAAMDPAVMAARLRAALPFPAGRADLVADAGADGIVGWAALGPYRPDETLDPPDAAPGGELYALYVRPDVIGTGVGRGLMTASLDLLRAFGHRHVRLWVVRENARARRFYERAGFTAEPTARTGDVGGRPLTEVRFART